MSQINNLVLEIMDLKNQGHSIEEIAAILNYHVAIIEAALKFEEEDNVD